MCSNLLSPRQIHGVRKSQFSFVMYFCKNCVGVFQMMIDSRQTHDSYSGVAWHAHLAGNDSDEDTQVYNTHELPSRTMFFNANSNCNAA